LSTAFVRFYEENVADVYAYLAYRVGSRAEAERLTQQTFERAARRWRILRAEPEVARVRLFGIARQLAGTTDTERERGDPGVAADLAGALAQLDRSARSVVALRLGGRLAAPEIATLLDESEDAVRRRLSRGLRRLRTELDGGRAGSARRGEDGGDDEKDDA
jgi:DNA-directed RNA polymerase specialized sigma24 family protein